MHEGETTGFVVAVCAVICDGDRVLAMRRAATKDVGAGLWETVSGRVRPGEALTDAMAREITEETGLEVALDPRPVDAYVARRGAAPMCVVVYRGTRVAGEVRRSDEHDAHAWLTPAELRACTPLTRLVEAVERAFAAP
jgi:8-oxo-dGTP diphosphatase